jgi:hypothetical protein
MKKCILFLILILFLLVHKSSFNSGDLYNSDKWGAYRIGDCIRFPEFLVESNPYCLLYHIYKYPGSIAQEYLQTKYPQLKDRNYDKKAFEKYINKNVESLRNDYPLLIKIINKRKTNEIIPENTLILHIRTGDVLCGHSSDQKKYSKVGDPGWWNTVVEYIKNHGITNVIILSGSHFKRCLERSKKYLKDRAEFLKKQTGVSIEYRIGKSPDDDILFVSNYKHFITTGGGYGALLSKIIYDDQRRL